MASKFPNESHWGRELSPQIGHVDVLIYVLNISQCKHNQLTVLLTDWWTANQKHHLEFAISKKITPIITYHITVIDLHFISRHLGSWITMERSSCISLRWRALLLRGDNKNPDRRKAVDKVRYFSERAFTTNVVWPIYISLVCCKGCPV